MEFKPLGDRVIVRPLEEQPRSGSGLLVVGETRTGRGMVLATGPGTREPNEWVHSGLWPGDTVLYVKTPGIMTLTANIEGEDVIVLRIGEIVGKLAPAPEAE